MPKEKGSKIVLTASVGEMSDYKLNPFVAFIGSFPKTLFPLWLLRKCWYPPPENNGDKTVKYAPYGLRKVEASLLENGFDESDIATVHPHNLDLFVGPETKVVGVSTMDPLGAGYVSLTYSSLVGGEPINAIEFRKLMEKKCFRKYNPKTIVGGAGAWQLAYESTRNIFQIDCVVIGESEKIIPELFSKAVKGEKLPSVIHANVSSNEEIPSIRKPSLYGCVEVSRGCGRNCRFCSPTMRNRRFFSLDEIMREVEVNVKGGSKMILLSTEDFLLYKAKNKSFIPNRDAVLKLFKKISEYPGVKIIQPTHMSLAPVVVDPALVSELSEILIEHSWIEYKGKPYVTAETGIETGSTHLIRRLMAGKPLPFKPEDWYDIVLQALGILNDSNWIPLATFVSSLPGETEDDAMKTLELVDDLHEYKCFFVPLLFVPLEECSLRNECRADLTSFSGAQQELFARCWEHNIRVWRASWLERKVARFILMWFIDFIYLTYYKWTNRKKFLRRLMSRLYQTNHKHQ
ncbi:MAG: B12-binding domain-containing radical SAM protein [Candidatus Bathyarchaeia archaeon]